MLRTLPILLATVVVLVSGVTRGIWTDRWSTRRDLDHAAARLDRVAITLGDWTGQPLEFDVEAHARAGIAGGLLRRFVDRRTGEAVSLLIVCGRPGPISVHTPEVCYAGAGYEVVEARTRSHIPLGADASPAEFWRIRLRKVRSIVPEFLDVHYAWSATGAWQAPDRDPRFEFAWYPSLYKLYVVRRSDPTGTPGPDPGLAFLRALLPELGKPLFPAS
jgi:hypothetical protein